MLCLLHPQRESYLKNYVFHESVKYDFYRQLTNRHFATNTVCFSPVNIVQRQWFRDIGLTLVQNGWHLRNVYNEVTTLIKLFKVYKKILFQVTWIQKLGFYNNVCLYSPNEYIKFGMWYVAISRVFIFSSIICIFGS